MKTLNTLLKMTSVVLLLVAFSSATIQLNAQESDEKTKEVKIKMVKEVNGKETVIDTTFEIASLEDLENIEGLEELGITLSEFTEAGEAGFQVMTFESDGDGEMQTMIITQDIEEEIGEDGEIIKTIDLIVEVADSLDNAKVITLKMEGNESTVFISDDEEIKTIETADGEKTIIIKHTGDVSDGDIIVMHGDDVDWHEKMGTNVRVEETDDGNIVIVTDENGEVSEFLIKEGEGAYMIDEEGNLTKMEDDKDIIWNDEGDNVWIDIEDDADGKVVVVKSYSTDEMDTNHNVFVTDGGDGEEREVFVNVIKKQDGDNTIIIKSKVIVETLDEQDNETMEKAGIDLKPESEENELIVESLKFSPNPSNGKFLLKFTTPQEGNADIKIYNINGVEVYSESLKNFNGTYENEIDISGEKSGTYFLKVTQGDNIMSRKIVIE